jgi:hypothetical protein
MEPAPLKDNLFGDKDSFIRSSSWTIWFTKLTTFLNSISASGVVSVTATSPLTSSLGATPNISSNVNSSKLLGRGSASSGAMQEVTLGTNLSMSGTTLNATGGGGSTPTGTGFRHVASGVEDAAAKLVENVDVSNSAGIVESKLSLNYSTHSNANDPTTDQKAALAGSSGTPSGTNKYVTDADSRNSNSRTPTSHHITHNTGQSDAIAPGDIGAAVEPTGTPDGTKFYADDHTWKVPPGGGSGLSHLQVMARISVGF